jgi:hypothetical protein
VGAAGPGVVAGGALGAILRKKSATDYDTEWKTPSSAQGFVATNPSITGLARKMFGLSGLITPSFSGKVLALISTSLKCTVSFTGQAQMHYGTGAAPLNGQASAGTAIGSVFQPDSDGGQIGSTFCAVVTGLTVGTQYWFDLEGVTTNAGASLVAVLPGVTLVELP